MLNQLNHHSPHQKMLWFSKILIYQQHIKYTYIYIILYMYMYIHHIPLYHHSCRLSSPLLLLKSNEIAMFVASIMVKSHETTICAG